MDLVEQHQKLRDNGSGTTFLAVPAFPCHSTFCTTVKLLKKNKLSNTKYSYSRQGTTMRRVLFLLCLSGLFLGSAALEDDHRLRTNARTGLLSRSDIQGDKQGLRSISRKLQDAVITVDEYECSEKTNSFNTTIYIDFKTDISNLMSDDIAAL